MSTSKTRIAEIQVGRRKRLEAWMVNGKMQEAWELVNSIREFRFDDATRSQLNADIVGMSGSEFQEYCKKRGYHVYWHDAEWRQDDQKNRP